MPPAFKITRRDRWAEKHGKDRLIGGARRQMDFRLGFELDDAGGDFDQTQSQGVELHTRQDERLGITRRIYHKSQ
jgi:hypothetical protein